jgi:hypothetical protein
MTIGTSIAIIVTTITVMDVSIIRHTLWSGCTYLNEWWSMCPYNSVIMRRRPLLRPLDMELTINALRKA